MIDPAVWSKEVLLEKYISLQSENTALELSHFQELEDLELELAKAELQVQQAEAKAEKAEALAADAREKTKNECVHYEGRNRTLQLQNDDLSKTSEELKVRLRTTERKLERVEAEIRVMTADLQNKNEAIERLEEEKVMRDEMEDEAPAPTRTLFTATHRMQTLVQQKHVRDLRVQLSVAQKEATFVQELQRMLQLEKERNLAQEAALSELKLSVEGYKKLQATVRSDHEAISHARSSKLEEKELQYKRMTKLNHDLGAKRAEVEHMKELRRQGAVDAKELGRLEAELLDLSKDMHTIIRSRLARQRFAKIKTVTRFMSMGKIRTPSPKHAPPPAPSSERAPGIFQKAFNNFREGVG
jgi:chromosome segregation ATPase